MTKFIGELLSLAHDGSVPERFFSPVDKEEMRDWRVEGMGAIGWGLSFASIQKEARRRGSGAAGETCSIVCLPHAFRLNDA